MSNYDDFNSRSDKNEDNTVHRSRRARKQKEAEASAAAAKAASSGAGTATAVKHKKKVHLNKKQFLKFLICVFLIIMLSGVGYVASVIIKAPPIQTDNIYSMLSQSSVLYDSNGEIIDSVFSGEKRTIVEINQIPKHVQNAFIALEDKTFETHHGFNVIRIFGAIKDAVFSGGAISGTSTITQQLARNLYIDPEERYGRNLSRKIKEAYYTVILERELNKDQILEAYLNTISFGCGNGVQTAAQVYFSKDIDEITIAEAAALAAMPQAPTAFALVYSVDSSEITEETPNLIMKDGDTAFLWNDAAEGRMHTCMALMHEQGLITDEEYEKNKDTKIKDIVNPNLDTLQSESNYFADFVIASVIEDFQKEGFTYEEAHDKVYKGGLKIYTTMDSQAQAVLEKEFKNDSNFPYPTNYSYDSKGNIKNSNGETLLYKYGNYITKDGYFRLRSNEYKKNDDGSITVYKNKRLLFYDTLVNNETDVSVEFRDMFVIENNKFYSIPGGYLNIPQQYKSKDSDGNLVISASFFKDYPDFFEEQSNGRLATKNFSLKQKVIQPQAAMTVIDNKTGAVKAMVGGRKVSGRMIYNRATAPRQPGSSIKPIAVYAAALQRSFELEEAGKEFPFFDPKIDTQGAELWGKYLTAASIVDDEPTTINGKRWPVNSYMSFRGLNTFRTALQQSINVCAVKILTQVGVDYSYDFCEKFGLTTLVEEGDVNDKNLAALAMGGMTRGVSTLEMASAYSTFVNNGVHKGYSCYTKVTTQNDDIILEPDITETKVMDEGVAWIMTDILKTVVSEGIGSPARISGTVVGGKTGTTNDKYDIWFDGFSANYSASLWIGNDVNIQLSSMSNIAASLWSKIMGQIDGVYGGEYAKRPSNVVTAVIDTKSGLLATDGSTSTRTEYFTSGTQPTESGTLNKTVEICSESGYLATPSCPHTETKSGIERPYKPNKNSGDVKKGELPHYYCHLHNPDPEEYPADPKKDVTIVEPPTEPEEPDINLPDPENPQPEPEPEPENPVEPIFPPEEDDDR